MVAKSIVNYFNKTPPFSLNWNKCPVPEELCYGVAFGEGNKVNGFGKGRAYGDEKILDLLRSENIYYSAKSSILKKLYTLDIIILDIENNKVWVCSTSL